MKKIYLSLLLAIFTFTGLMAKDGYQVLLTSEPRIHANTGHKNEIPSVTLIESQNSLTCYSDSIQEVYIKVYDSNKSIIFEGNVCCSEVGSEIAIPFEDNRMMDSVEIYTKDSILYGSL